LNASSSFIGATLCLACLTSWIPHQKEPRRGPRTWTEGGNRPPHRLGPSRLRDPWSSTAPPPSAHLGLALNPSIGLRAQVALECVWKVVVLRLHQRRALARLRAAALASVKSCLTRTPPPPRDRPASSACRRTSRRIVGVQQIGRKASRSERNTAAWACGGGSRCRGTARRAILPLVVGGSVPRGRRRGRSVSWA
jgi:hypothetical protein